MTITEALAEIKTIQKRIDTKRKFICDYAARQDLMKDPLESKGGSKKVLAEERQAIGDLQDRIVKIRTAIQKINLSTEITIAGITKSISEWLTWRKEIAEKHLIWIRDVLGGLQNLRKQAAQKGLQVRAGESAPTSLNDMIVNVDEAALQAELEIVQDALGTLDGQLSLKNATVMVEI